MKKRATLVSKEEREQPAVSQSPDHDYYIKCRIWGKRRGNETNPKRGDDDKKSIPRGLR
jgi:hypothetical protein